jgi:hypothetical protein
VDKSLLDRHLEKGKRARAFGQRAGIPKSQILFYTILLLGNALFAGWPTAAAATGLIFLLNVASSPLTESFVKKFSPSDSLVIRSLLSLGLFPYLWLLTVAVFGALYGWFLAGLVLLVFLTSSFANRRKQAVPTNSHHGQWPFCLVFAAALVLFTTYLPFSRLGERLPEGSAYRAYFSSDYLKQFSLVHAVGKAGLPPANPYFSGVPLHYYWLPYATPSFVSKFSSSVPRAMFSFSFMVNFLFVALLLLLLRQICSRCRTSPYFLALAVFTASLEGLYFFARDCRFSWIRFLRLGSQINIDAFSRVRWGLPQIDTLLRSLFYTPQHLLGLCLLGIFILAFSAEDHKPWFLSLLLALSLTASFFIGGVLLIAWMVHYAIKELGRLLRRQARCCSILGKGATYFLFPLLTLALFEILKMSRLYWMSDFFVQRISPGHVGLLLFLNVGPLLLFGLAGLALVRCPARSFYLMLFLLSVLLTIFVRIRGFENDLSLKVGLVIMLQCLILTAHLFEKFRIRRWAAFVLVVFLVIPGSLTSILDIHNSADINNPTFTFYLPDEEQIMLTWIRGYTPASAIVQTFPPARESNISIVPSFAGRDMYVGDIMHGEIFQIQPEEYKERIRILEQSLRNLPASASELRKLGISYLFWGKAEEQYFGYSPKLRRVCHLPHTVLYSLD